MTPALASLGIWLLAVLGVLWMLVPLVMYHLRRTTIRNDIVGGATSALPAGRDRSYEWAFREFTAAGFAPAGSTVETTWFLTSVDWRKKFPRARWLVSEDGRTFVACYRLHPLERVRFSIHSLNDRGGLMLTVSPGAGIDVNPGGDDLRVEVRLDAGAALVARHHAEVTAFCHARQLSVVPTTFAAMVEQDAAFDRRFSRKVTGSVLSAYLLAFLLVPFLIPLLGTANGDVPGFRDPPLALLKSVGYFAVWRAVALPIGLIVVGFKQLAGRLFDGSR